MTDTTETEVSKMELVDVMPHTHQDTVSGDPQSLIDHLMSVHHVHQATWAPSAWHQIHAEAHPEGIK